MKLTLLAASPMYYQVPTYKLLAAEPSLDFHVVYASAAGVLPHDAGFGRPITWDYPLLEGYSCEFLRGASSNPLPERVYDLRDWDVARVVARRRGVWWLHGYNTVTHVVARATIGSLRLPWMIREEQNLLSPRPWQRRLAKGAMLRGFLHGAEAVYIGKANRNWLRHYGVPQRRLHWAPYVVDNEALRNAASGLSPRREALRASRGCGSEHVLLVSVIRLIEKKQPLALIRAFAAAAKDCPELRLRIVGDGPLMTAATTLVKELGMGQRITFAGFTPQSDMAAEYVAADCFVLFSSHDETWGLVVNEAMNFGLPVIVSNRVGSAYDLVEDGSTGLLVPHDDLPSLSAAMVRIARDPGLRQRLGETARGRIQHFRPEVSAAGIVKAARAAHARRYGATSR